MGQLFNYAASKESANHERHVAGTSAVSAHRRGGLLIGLHQPGSLIDPKRNQSVHQALYWLRGWDSNPQPTD